MPTINRRFSALEKEKVGFINAGYAFDLLRQLQHLRNPRPDRTQGDDSGYRQESQNHPDPIRLKIQILKK